MFGSVLGTAIQALGKLASAIIGISDEKKRRKTAARNLEKYKRDNPRKTDR